MISSATSGNTVDLSAVAAVRNAGLSQEETNEFFSLMQDELSLSPDQARALLSMVRPDQVRAFLSQAKGEQAITVDEAQQRWGLSDEQTDLISADGKTVSSSYNNPFGTGFLFFLKLSYAFELDLKNMMKGLLTARVESAQSAAEERKTGAIVKFAIAMTSAAVTAAGGLMHAHQAGKHKDSPVDPKTGQRTEPQPSQWTSPIGISLVTQPINAVGEFADQLFQYEAALRDIDAEEANALYQQIESTLQSSERGSSDIARKL